MLQRRSARRCRYRRRMQTPLQDSEVQHSEGDQGIRKQEIFQEILNFFHFLCLSITTEVSERSINVKKKKKKKKKKKESVCVFTFYICLILPLGKLGTFALF